MRRDARTRNRNKKKKERKTSNNYKYANITLGSIVIFLLVVFILITIFYYFKHQNDYRNLVETSQQEIEREKQLSEDISEEEIEKPVNITFTLSAIGDIMCHNTQYLDAYDKDTNSYDFSYVFEDISLYTKTADICVGNLETTFAGEDVGYSSYPTFNTPDNLAYELKDIGLDVLSTAGNHALDKGFSGLSRTIDILNDADISHLGTYKTQEDQNKTLIKYVKGIKIAFVNYTYGTNGLPIPSDKPFCVNLIDKELMKKQIDSAKEEKPDIIIACMHWGTEYKTIPNSSQEDLADFLFQNGVDIILGTHPHVLEPMEKRTITLEDGSTKDGFVIYSLGNFISGQNADNTKNSIILNLDITKHVDGTITIDNYDYVPIYMYTDTTKKEQKMKLLDINKTIYNYENYLDTSISKNLYNTLKNELSKIHNILD